MSNKTRDPQSPLTYFICYKNYRRYLSRLTPEQVGELHLALYDFAFDGAVREFGDLSVQLLYDIMIDQISRDSERYMTKVENGRRGGRPRKNPEPADISSVNAEKPKITSETAQTSHFSDPCETEENRIITDNNQDNDEEYEEDQEQEEDQEEDQENDTADSFSLPKKENESASQEEDQNYCQDQEYSEPAPIAQGLDNGDGCRNRLGAPSVSRQQGRQEDHAIGRCESCGEYGKQDDDDPSDDPYYFEMCIPDDDEDRLNSLLSGDCCPLPRTAIPDQPAAQAVTPAAKRSPKKTVCTAHTRGKNNTDIPREPAAPPRADAGEPHGEQIPEVSCSKELEEGFLEMMKSMFRTSYGSVKDQELSQEQMGALSSYAKNALFHRT